MKKIALAAIAVSLASCATLARPDQAVHSTAGEAAAAFLRDFNALDPTAFDSHFADEVTMFFPDGPFPAERIEGKPAVTAVFHGFFEALRAEGRTRLAIVPSDLRVQDHGDMAITSFELRGTEAIGRRSLVWQRRDGAWRIVHFHASSRDLAPGQ